MTVEDYAFAEAEFHHYKRALADYAARLAEAAAALRERTDRVTVAHAGLGAVPAGGSPAGLSVIDGAVLPQATDIQRTLLRYHGAFERLRAIWDALPPAERAALRPPPPSLPILAQAA